MDKLLNRIINKIDYEWRILKKRVYYLKNYSICNPKINIDEVDKVLFISHPDDEILFFSNELIQSDGWLIVCITNGSNKIRLKEFIFSMNEIKANYQIWDFPDGLNTKWDEKKLTNKIIGILNLKDEWKKVMTHNSEGEYGHYQHKQLHKLITQTYKGQNFYTSSLKQYLVSDINRLTNDKFNKKINILRKCYKSQEFVMEKFQIYCEYESVTRIK